MSLKQFHTMYGLMQNVMGSSTKGGGKGKSNNNSDGDGKGGGKRNDKDKGKGSKSSPKVFHNYTFDDGRKAKHVSRWDDWACNVAGCPVVTNRASHTVCFGCRMAKGALVKTSQPDAAAPAGTEDATIAMKVKNFMDSQACKSPLVAVQSVELPRVNVVGNLKPLVASITSSASSSPGVSEAQKHLLDPETLKFTRAASNSIVASIAAAAQEALRNHEEAYRAQKVEEVTAKIDLTILSPAQGVEHLATELQAKKKHRSDALTHWEGKRKSDEENFNKLKEEMQEAVKQAQNNLEQTTAWYTAQRLMRETQHAESLKAIDGTITALESKLAEAKRKEAAAGDRSHVPPTPSEQFFEQL